VENFLPISSSTDWKRTNVAKLSDRFIDTNVLLYLLSDDARKADRAEDELANGGIISVQVLNEFAAIALRKLKMSIAEVREVLATIRAVCKIVPMTEETHDKGLVVAEKYGLSLYDAMIVAAALLSGSRQLLSEDMQHGQKIAGTLKIQNPFR
jgi:predicted nucleic acid-binding protein